ncbi:hypothetical protein COU37_00745 [Candidatus Micrarchaeota archaeon CG10_big_fil_rev_8_21_14_0_10_45_29]|nr:MAG: hypothetical protein COU37_00745 [Candidatus Micrarchaeota archaeon CG10_big_fil_rev_8_21_14_0_10_45_29]
MRNNDEPARIEDNFTLTEKLQLWVGNNEPADTATLNKLIEESKLDKGIVFLTHIRFWMKDILQMTFDLSKVF